MREAATVPSVTLSARRLVGVVALALVLTVARSPAGTGASTPTIAATNFQFAPDSISVAVGDTVSWTFSGAPHTVTSGLPGAPDGRFDSGIVNPGGTFTVTFSTPGTYPFFCGVHPAQMSGTVVVVALPGDAPTPGPTPPPTPRATPAPAPTEPATPSPSSSPAATPSPSPSPAATPSASRASSTAPLPLATSTAGPSPVDAGSAGGSLPPTIIWLGLLILVASGALVRARRRRP